ncbi:MAG: hypothetical protein ABIP75_14825 [Pyrinomonadaceae bacterium]
METRWRDVGLLMLLLVVACERPVARNVSKPVATTNQPAAMERAQLVTMEGVFTTSESLEYLGFRVNRRHKRVLLEGIGTNVSYGILRHGAQEIAQFDGLYHPSGNSTNFGLFPFLGGKQSQLVVEQSTQRNWRHWIIRLSPEYHVVFDSRDFGVDGELRAVDPDADGVYEIWKRVSAFYFFDNLSASDSPLVDVLFRYDARADRYLPAGQSLSEFSLKGIEEEIKNAYDANEPRYESNVLHIVLRYVYAGRERDGWAYYEREFTSPKKEQIRSDVLRMLKKERVHAFIYGGGATEGEPTKQL